MIQDKVYLSVSETFEGLAFLEISPEDNSTAAHPAESSDEWRWSSVAVCAPISAVVILLLPESLVLEIASSLYGAEAQSVPEASKVDLVGEMANTLAGKLMSALHPGDIFTLGMPETGKGSPQSSSLSRYGFLTDDERSFAIYTDLVE